MAIFDLFSKRQKRDRGQVPDVYSYDAIPNPLRVQIVHIWQETLGNSTDYDHGYNGTPRAYEFIVKTLCREYGLFELPGSENLGHKTYLSSLANFILKEKDYEKVLDVIELSFKVIDAATREYNHRQDQDGSAHADAAIKELNARFQEHSLGFQFIDGKIIRIDSALVHAEVVKPALALLHDKDYSGAQSEFIKAHEHYRHGNEKEALTECAKALESVMKTICDKRRWKYQSNATMNTLIGICVDNGLIPQFWTQHFTSLRSTLETGVAPARNKLGGHGQGAEIVEVPKHIVAYVLHMTAAGIVFLVESERALR